MHEFELSGGPQDGAKVRGEYLPLTIYVGPKWMGDGCASWGSDKCDRFPCRYDYAAGRFVFVPA